jgi:hypothetical protein
MMRIGWTLMLIACGGGQTATPPPAESPTTAAPANTSPTTGTPCPEFARHLYPVFAAEMTKASPMVTVPPLEEVIAECERHPEDHGSPFVACVVAAQDEAAVRTCLDSVEEKQGSTRTKKTEAQLVLNRIGKNLKALYIEAASVPKGTTGLTPPAPCCGQLDNKCASNTLAWTSSTVWCALDTVLEEPTLLQYAYESTDGVTATVRAVGDLDCDGRTIEYVMTFSAVGGNPSVTIAEPPPSSG